MDAWLYLLKFARYFLRRIELERRHFPHIVILDPLADKRPTTSTQSTHRLKVYLVGYNSVADNRLRLYGTIVT